MKLTVIGNPVSGRGRALRLIQSIQAGCAARGIDVSVNLTSGPGDAEAMARDLLPRTDVLVVVGGDGTVHECVNGIMPNPVPIAIVPTGTGNDYASLFDSPQNAASLFGILEDGMGARLDVLDFGSRFCANSAGMGFEGLVNRFSQGGRRVTGPLHYLAAVFKALKALRCLRFHLSTAEGETIDGERLLVSIGNGNRTGGGFYMTPQAHPDDGLIDVCVIDPMSRLRVVRLLPTALRGTHVHQPEVRVLRTSRLVVEVSGDHPMHIDGELFEDMPERIVIEVHRGVLPVLCRGKPRGQLQEPLRRIL